MFLITDFLNHFKPEYNLLDEMEDNGWCNITPLQQIKLKQRVWEQDHETTDRSVIEDRRISNNLSH